MLRNLFITWLIVSILGYGLGVAVNAHDDSTTDKAQISTHVHHDDTDTGADGDHCCHGTFHLLGLGAGDMLPVTVSENNFQVTFTVSFSSTIPNIPIRPPITV